VKWYGLDFEFVLYELSFVNVIMMNSVIPSTDHDSKDDKKKEKKQPATKPMSFGRFLKKAKSLTSNE